MQTSLFVCAGFWVEQEQIETINAAKSKAINQYFFIVLKIVGAANTGQRRPKIRNAATFATCGRFLSSTIFAQMAANAVPNVR